jgi:CO/xanthine dehydrogenase Mo-binding subunit
LLFDGGAYASSTGAVVGNGGTLGLGPYNIPNVQVDCYGVYTNNPPCGAMRGFGCVQAAFAHEALMDELADRLGMDRVAIRQLNGMREGDRNITGQLIDSAAPVAELLQLVKDMPLPAERSSDDELDLRSVPGGVSNTTHGEGVVRGIGYAVTYKNVGFSEGFDDYSTARVRLEITAGEPTVTVHTAAAEVGQGLITVEQQICRTELGVERVVVHPRDTQVGSGGSTSASRQTYVTGGAVKAACEAVRGKALERAGAIIGHKPAELRLDGAKIVSITGEVVASLPDVLGTDAIDETVKWSHRPTYPIDPETGQGNAHVQYAFSAHRAVVDVDVDLGLVKVIALDTAQDVGKAINPDAVVGQIQGGSAQGMGLALMEEVIVTDGKVRNPSFTDYLIPTILDMPPMKIEVLEYADPHAPYGVRGVGEPPTISSGPAVAAAIRQATGKALRRVPIRPEHITES